MHAQDFQEPKGDTICTKYQKGQEVTQRCEKLKLSKLYQRSKSTQD
jgi:hypothetical protein